MIDRDALVNRLNALRPYTGRKGSITQQDNEQTIDDAIALLTAPVEDSEAFTHIYWYQSPGGLEYWRHEGGECNGSMPIRSQPLYAAPRQQDARSVREELPPGYTDVADYIAEQEKDPVKAEALRKARIRLHAHMREAVIEECARVCEQWGNDKVARLQGNEELVDSAKASAWDALQCAAAIRALPLAAHPAEPAGKGE